MHYVSKVIISGPYYELYRYGKVLWRDFKRTKRRQKRENATPAKRPDSIARTRSMIRRIIHANPDLLKFVTLTFSDNMTEITIANRHFNKFVMRLNYRFSDFKYICIIEFQKRGAVHYHLLCNLSYIPNATLAEIWGHGYVRINRIKHVDNVGAYVCKYLHKDMDDKRLLHRKKFFHSKNLNMPIELFDEFAVEGLVKLHGLEVRDPDYETTFHNEYTGKVHYKSFKIPLET